ncbi:MAG: dihydroorotase [Minisyncoccia bacterium]
MRHVLNYLPFDSHVHFRRGAMLKAVAPFTAKQCWGAVVMPNTATPHILTPEDAVTYKEEILGTVGETFSPIITGYLAPATTYHDVRRGFKSGAWHAMKVYPPGATTHSNEGVMAHFLPEHPVLPAMQDMGMPLLLHPEVTYDKMGFLADIYDREKLFLDTIRVLRKKYPKLRISVEHVTDRETARFMMEMGDPEYLVCTVTPQHMLFDRRDLHKDGFQPHLFCYPILKRQESKEAVLELATSGLPFVSAGTDSAPHPTHAKEKACGCAGGVFSAPRMIELYTEIFEKAGKLANLEEFLCVNGPRFYGVSPKGGMLVLEKGLNTLDALVEVENDDKIRPFGYHEDPKQRYQFQWTIAE